MMLRLRRFRASLVDQVLSSGTNFIVIALAARWLGPHEFGPLAIAMAVVALGLALQRAVVGEPMLAVGAVEGQRRRLYGDAVRVVLVGGVALSAVALVATPVAPSLTGDLWMVALFLPIVLLQDALRYVAFAAGEPHQAVAGDAVWAVAELALLPVMWHVLGHRPFSLVLSWGIGATLGLVPLARKQAARTGVTGSIHRWRQATRELSHWLVGQAALSHLVLQLTLFLVGVRFGQAAAGGYRAMQTLTLPIAMAMTGLQAFLVPDVVRRARGDRARVDQGIHGYAVGAAAVLLPAAAAAYWVAPEVIRVLFGEDYLRYRSLLPIFAFALAVQAIASPYAAVLRARRDGRGLLVAQLFAAVVGVVGMVADVAWWTLAGAAVVYLLMSVALAATTFVRATREPAEPRPVPPSEPPGVAAASAVRA